MYYGRKIPDYDLSSFEKRPTSNSPFNAKIGQTGFSPSCAPMEIGTNLSGDFRISSVCARNSKGDNVTDLRYADHRIYKGKAQLKSMPSAFSDENDADTLEIDTIVHVTEPATTEIYTVFSDSPAMIKSARFQNTSNSPIYLERAFSLCNTFQTMDYDLISLYGQWKGERFIERRPLAHGIQGVESLRGSSSHDQNPFIALAKKGASEESGEVFGFNLIYSGNFSAMVQCDYNCITRVIMGINPQNFEWKLSGGDIFEAPEAVCIYSHGGIGEMSRSFHKFYNKHLLHGKYMTAKRPILINNWEATRFDIDNDTLISFAKSAKELGIEMLVMDDGWFGKRYNEKSSLGDWFVNEDKIKGGLNTLIKDIKSAGLDFGIWFEPEMISPDSDLFREHPDYHIHIEGREPIPSRYQYVLDFSRKEVIDNIWEKMYKILSENDIKYLKWDFNRSITDAGSAYLPADRQKEFLHRFILGTYDLMGRLTENFPDILFENCASGGGRFDPAMLYYSPQIWASDNTDPIARLFIQFGTSMCYPASAMGAHISANKRGSLKTKGDIALWGSFGYELDPRYFSDEEKEIIKKQISDYHKYYELIRNGELYRIISPFEDNTKAAWMIVSEDRSEFLFTLVPIVPDLRENLIIKFKGLDENKFYKEEESGNIYSGALLMYAGINMTYAVNSGYESTMLHFTEI